MEVAKIMKQLNAGTMTIDSLLSPPGTHIKDVPVDDLQIDIMASGFSTLDAYMLLKKGRSELVVIGGRPSHGKSALMFQLALQVSRSMPVHVFSLEMDKEQIATRLIAGLIDKPITAIQRGLIDRKLLNEASKELGKLAYIVDDRSGLNISQIADSARRRAKTDGTGLIIIDYLQLIKKEKGHSVDDEIGNITRSLKELAKDLKVPIVVGSQLNRQSTARGASSGNFRPLLSDLRESGNIEQDADMVLFVNREYLHTGQRPSEADIIVAKNRNGPIGDIVMQYVPTQTKFYDKDEI